MTASRAARTEARRGVYRAYLEEAERLREAGRTSTIRPGERAEGEFQEFLQERNRDRDDSDGRPDRGPTGNSRLGTGARTPCDDQGHVQFPDVRIEYDIDGRDHTLDVEVMTPHYRGAHAAAKSGSGFSLYFSARSGGGVAVDARRALSRSCCDDLR